MFEGEGRRWRPQLTLNRGRSVVSILHVLCVMVLCVCVLCVMVLCVLYTDLTAECKSLQEKNRTLVDKWVTIIISLWLSLYHCDYHYIIVTIIISLCLSSYHCVYHHIIVSIIISLCLSSYHCDLLWYVRCVAEEEQKNDANRDNTTLNKKVRELQVALQELGREYLLWMSE